MKMHGITGRLVSPPPSIGTPAHGSEPIVDSAAFKELWESVSRDAEPLRDIATSFRKTVAECLAALDDGCTEKALRHLHTVIGTGGLIGAKQIRSLALELQDAFKAGDERRLEKLKRELATASVQFERAFLERLDAKDRSLR